MSANRLFVSVWVAAGWAALAIAGLFSLVPVLLRGPLGASLPDAERVFSLSLAVHVNASVLFWLSAALNALHERRYAPNPPPKIFSLSLPLYAIGLICVTASAFLPGATPLKNNYVPVVFHPVFFIGLAAFALHLLCGLIAATSRFRFLTGNAVGLAIWGAYATATAGCALWIIDAAKNPPPHPAALLAWAESVFWSGGHLVVAAYGLIAAALWTQAALREEEGAADRLLRLAFLVFLMSCAGAALQYLVAHDSMIWTNHMRAFDAVPALAASLVALRYALFAKGTLTKPERATLVASIALFFYGGALGFAIREENAVVPSHYHASIVGITVAAMGYFLKREAEGLPKMRRVSVAYALLLCYAAAQALHVTGLWTMGGYGVLRKAPGSLDGLASAGAKMFFAGGGLAVLCAAGFAVAFFCVAYARRRAR
ncbi:MAG: hypothetical protein ABW189_03915 [Rickettsiales bacterium]